MSGNAFDLLSSLGEDGDGEWETVGSKESKKNKKQQQQQQQAQGASSSRQPPAAVGPRNSSTNNNTAALRALKEAALRDMKQEKSQPQQPKQQQQQQSSNSQQQQPSSRTHDHKGRPQGDNYYRAFQRCFVSDRTGDVVLRFHKTDIVKVKGTGEVLLTSGGYLTLTTMMSMNDALSHVGIKIRTTGGDIRDASSWSIQLPGAASMAYEDNVVIPARTAADKGRARSVLEGLQALNVPVQVLRAPGAAGTAGAAGAAGGSGQLSAQRAALVQRQAQVQAQMQQAGRPVPSPVVHAPQSYAARLAANINRQQAQQAQQGAGAPAGTSTSGGGAAGAAGGAVGANGAGANASAGEGAGSAVPLPPGGPAQFAARSAALSADAFAQFLSPQTDYIAPSGWGADDDEEDEDAEVGGDASALAAKFNHLVGGLGAELEEEDDSLLCVMCMERPQETILIPCSHAVLCTGCADCLMAKNKGSSVGGACPICRTEVMEVISVAD